MGYSIDGEFAEKNTRFNQEREWEQYHSPKNLAIALMIEAGEVAEHFQWLTEEESRSIPTKKREEIKDEVGDVLIYLINLADKLDINPIEAAREKIEKNRAKYPAEKVRGKADKYTEYD